MFNKIVFICVLFLIGCSQPSSPTKSDEKLLPQNSCQSFLNNPQNNIQDPLSQLSKQEHLRWLEKTSMALRNGKDLSKENIEELLKKTRSEIVDMWMNEVGFQDTVLDFSMMIWGQKQDFVKKADRTYNDRIYEVPTAISAAQAMAQNGDFFSKLIEYRPPVYQQRFFKPTAKTEEQKKLSEKNLRIFHFTKIEKDLAELTQKFVATPPKTNKEFCEAVVAALFDNEEHFTNWFYTGLFLPNILFSLNERWYNFDFCFPDNDEGLTVDPIQLVSSINERNNILFKNALEMVEKTNLPYSVGEIKKYSHKNFAVKEDFFSAIGDNLKDRLQNSSTNMNRKRAAFFLDRFFCDSLTPIGVEEPAIHPPGNTHVTESSCRACHYKLDPMAGFFAKYGRAFEDMTSLNKMIFDDGAKADLAKYIDNWKNNETGEWETGYVRSPTEKQMNTYGRTMEDLFQIMQTAPEVKRCLTKRTFEYFIAPGQVIDAGYLDYLTQDFTCGAETNSSEAFKRMVKRLVLSKTFMVKDLEPDKCYDYPPNYNPEGMPPCKVAAVLQKNCVTCHSSAGAEGRLDLSKWEQYNNEWTFPHKNKNGEQKNKKDTLNKMIDLISTTNENKRMPKDTYMNPLDRETLYLWLNEEVNK